MSVRGAIWLVLALAVTGCSTTRLVRLDTGDKPPMVHTPLKEDDAALVELDDDEFEEAVVAHARDVRPFSNPLREARQRFGVPERSGVYLYEGRGPRLIPQDEAEDSDGPRLLESYADDELTRAYGRWCERKSQPGDCLRLLAEGPLLASDGKYSLAMAIAMDSVWDETAEALEDMADPQALLATVSASVSMYLLLWSLPEPVSKGLAALLTATAIAYLGVDTVWRILDGWVTLVREVERATSFAQLSAAGEVYGEVLGENAARVFVMLATAAIGNTAGLAAKTSKLPGSAQAAIAVEAQAGYQYVAIGGVQSVAMTAEGFTIALAPSAVAMAAQGMRGGRSEKHHLATNKNSRSAARGGPWTPRFKRLFKKAGMRLEDPENIVPVKGHRGPHPQQYHELVFADLDAATAHCRSVSACRSALQSALRRLAKEITTRGTELNLLLTRGATP
ncbi:AHH domain-containing protein [Corallococcus macrosporus]|uniref:Putative lipoprotein n=1 Tax=Myxococcus fulvus (strain ATCC BAA-855 / HW-1) TaxID=483219 RepID=F8CH76_MYXFH|nr:AHH domain-containing protein [Corallococcus macrosporus]AEI64993.1 putative lipoprotein [Corallococcus macrosporus]